jgi:type IX secretion system PorP/SprF family membrane protein
VKKIIVLIFGLIPAVLWGQDVYFSQSGQTPLLLNPASAGVFDGYYRGILNYKNQWGAMGKAYNTVVGSFDMPVAYNKRNKSSYYGVGVYVLSDKAGTAGYSTTQGDFSFSAIVPLGACHTLSAGIEAGLTFRNLDITAIQWPNQYNGNTYDPTLPSNENPKAGNFFFFDMGAGIFYQYLRPQNKFYGRNVMMFSTGVSIYHAARMFSGNNPNSKRLLYPRIVIQSNFRYDFKGTKFGIMPMVLYMNQGPAYELDLGMLLRFRLSKETNFTGYTTESAFSFGATYRHKNAVVPQVFFEIANFGFGVSYDINISSFAKSLGYNGGLEFSVKYSKMKGATSRNWK